MERPTLDDLTKQYAALDNVLNDSTSGDAEKLCAAGAQNLLFEEVLAGRDCKITARAEHALRVQHSKKADTLMCPSFARAQWRNVEKRLKGIKPDRQPTQFPVLDELFFEPQCRGQYESCQKDEISALGLQVNWDAGSEAVNVADNNLKVVHKLNNSVESFLENLQNRPRAPAPRATMTSLLTTPSVPSAPNLGFRTASEELQIQNLKKQNSGNFGGETAGGSNDQGQSAFSLFNYGAVKKSLGARRTVRSNFVPPVRPEDSVPKAQAQPMHAETTSSSQPIDEHLVNIDPKMIELISNEIMHKYNNVGWDDIAGLDYAKSIIKEAVVYPLLRPDLFTGLRRPPRGILLFGPPGTGKTLIGKCIASHSQSTFFSISASALTSKWVGDGEKMVRALFAVAAVHQPSVIFIDEIDSLLSQRSDTEHESSRRIKTEFLVQLDGASTSDDDRILIVGATNRPHELDEAARRRFTKRLYIPLPESAARVQIINKLLKSEYNILNAQQIEDLSVKTDGYSGADMESLCREASMEPIRSIPPDEIPTFNKDNMRAVTIEDFITALQSVRPSVSQGDLQQYLTWNKQYGASK